MAEDLRTKQAHKGATPDLRTEVAAKLWEAALEKGTFTAPELAKLTGSAPSSAAHIIPRWEIEGFLRKTGKGAHGAQAWSLVHEARRPYGPEETRMWMTIRSLRTFSFRDVAVSSSLEDAPVDLHVAEKFVRMLIRSGHVRERVAAKPGVSEARFQLTKNTGPKPPFTRRVTVYVDPNTGEVLLPEDYR